MAYLAVTGFRRDALALILASLTRVLAYSIRSFDDVFRVAAMRIAMRRLGTSTVSIAVFEVK
jgi:hypothetical protein